MILLKETDGHISYTPYLIEELISFSSYDMVWGSIIIKQLIVDVVLADESF